VNIHIQSGSMLSAFALVAAGGGLGSAGRYALSLAASGLRLSPLMGTLAANTAGCLAAGVLLGGMTARASDDPRRLLLMVGVLGGLTTFSAFSVEAFSCLREGKWAAGLAYVAGTLALGLTCVWLGAVAGNALLTRA
jgi:fluoride exporter